jgi:hypothetical protein
MAYVTFPASSRLIVWWLLLVLAGEVGIDDALVMETKEEIYEMNNGCVCCTGRVTHMHTHLHTHRPTFMQCVGVAQLALTWCPE